MAAKPAICGGDDSGCCAGGIVGTITDLLASWRTTKQALSQEDFEKLISFLGAVPIFRKQLPRSELPRVAELFKESSWQPGTSVIKRGQDGKAFFIIKSGEASVLTPDDRGDETERTVLYALDYFGGHTLIERRPNVATIVAKGPAPLVTLSIDRKDFEALGLHQVMKFPRRPAIYDGTRADMVVEGRPDTGQCMSSVSEMPITEEDVDFICRAVMANPNMKRSFGSDLSDEKVRQFAQTATRHKLQAGTELGKAGDLLQALYVVSAGELSVFAGGASDQHSSMERKVATLSAAQARIAIKENFIRDLTLQSATGDDGAEQPNDSLLPSGARKKRVANSVRVQGTVDSLTPSGKSARAAKPRTVSMTGRAGAAAVQGPSPFKVGERAARVVVGANKNLVREFGTVTEVLVGGPNGEVMVAFDEPTRRERIRVKELRPVIGASKIAMLKKGSCYGELSLLYNTRLVTTCRAETEAEVFVMSRTSFKDTFIRNTAKLEERYDLLDVVHFLNPLVRSERWVLARSATGVLEFAADEVVVRQDDPLDDQKHLYIVKTGSCIVKQVVVDANGNKEERVISELRRAGHFGERDIFLKLKKAEATVQAGPEGLSVLAIHGDILRQFMESVVGDEGVVEDYAEYVKVLPKGAQDHAVHVAFNDLEGVSLLGEGGFGSVFKVRAKQTGQEFALKRLSKGYVEEARAEKQVALERDILTMVASDFIIKLYQTYKDSEFVYMLLELCDGGHLFELLAASKVTGGALLPSAVMFYVASLTYALEHLHERKVAFRDLKAENVLLDKRGYVKLCDMGFAKFVVDKTNTLLGTPEYMAPEMIDPPHSHGHMVDWWALGVLTFELFTGQDPWYDSGMDGDDPMAQLLAIRDSQDEGFPERLLPAHQKSAKDFISKLLQVKPRSRLGSRGDGQEVRQHSWFTQKEFDFNALVAQTLPAPDVPERRIEPPSVPPVLDPELAKSADDALFAPARGSTSGWDSAF